MRKDQVLFWGLLSFVGGTAWASFFVFTVDIAFFLLGLALALICITVFPSRFVFVGALFFLLFSFGVFWAGRAEQSFASLQGEEVSAEGRVTGDPQEKSFYRETILTIERCQGEPCPEKRILWRAPLTDTSSAGDRYAFQCRLEIPENFSPDFDYRMFLAKDGIGFLCQNMEIVESLPQDARGKAFRALYAPKHFFERILSQMLPEPEAGLAKGLLLGGSDYLSRDFEKAFRTVGLSHIVAVSGYNITLIIECFLALGLFLGLWRRQALYFALVGITLFVLMIGLPASAIRAAVMASLVFVAWRVGRISRPIPILLFAASCMLLLNPLLLRHDVGFQLSFLATLALIIVQPFEHRIFTKEFFGVGGLKILWLTFVVHIFVLPVILYNFHVFSPLSFILNLLVVLVPWAMAFSFFAGLLFFLPLLQTLVSLPAYLTLLFITWPVEYLSAVSIATVEVAQFSAWHAGLWYVLLLFVMIVLEKYRKKIIRVYPL